MDNKNPYHSYNDMEVIDFYTRELTEALDNGTMTLPNFIEGEVINKWWYCDCFGMDTYKTKQDMEECNTNKIPTKKWNGKVYPYRYRKKGKLKKNGEPYKRTKRDKIKKGYPIEFDYEAKEWVYETHYGEMEYYSSDFQCFCEYYKDYRQISAGLSHNERFVVVADFDLDKDENENVIPNSLVPFNGNTISLLENICYKYSIPHFTYLEEHTDKGSFQVGWILDKPFCWNNTYNCFPHYEYINLIHQIAVIFGSDKNYKGWLIKNPNYIINTNTRWYNDYVDMELLVSSVKTAYYDYFYHKDIEDSVQPYTHTITERPKHIDKHIDSNSSRNCELFDRLRFWYIDYLLKNNEYPSYNELIDKANEISVLVGKLTKKGTLNPNEIMRTANSVNNYFKNRSITHKYTERQKVGNLVLGTQKEETLLDIFLMKKEGMKNKDIISKLEVSKSTVDKGIRFIKDNQSLFSKDTDYKCLIPNTLKLLELNYKHKYTSLCNRIMGKVYKIKA